MKVLHRFAFATVIAAGLITLIFSRMEGSTGKVFAAAGQSDSPTDASTDPTTGHKVVRISRELGRGSYNFYFHQNSFTANGDKYAYTHINAGPGQSLWAMDIANSASFGSGKSTHLADAIRLLAFPVVAAKSREVIYLNDHTLFATNLDSLKTRTITTLPAEWDMSPSSVSGFSLNSDETLLVGSDTLGASGVAAKVTSGPRQGSIDTVSAAHLPTFLFTVDMRSGKTTVINKGTDWYDHVQFSPKDPSLIMFAHEGPWDKVDRIWLIHSDGSGLVDFHPRTSNVEACGHEFWGPDGRTVWCAYRGADNAWSLLGQDVSSGKQTRYKLASQEMSRHFNISHDGKFFIGDGDVGNPMIQALYPQPDGSLRYVPLCAASDDYNKREPNVMLSPDDKWVVFASTKSGQSEVYAVEVNK